MLLPDSVSHLISEQHQNKKPSRSVSPALAPLYNRDFRLLFAGFAMGQMLGPMQFLTQILWVQENAPDNIWLILVALIGASRGVGALSLGLYGGALADRFDRRKLLLVSQALLLLTSLAIAALMILDVTTTMGFVLFFTVTFFSAAFQAIDSPTRLAIIPDILGYEHTAAGMSLNQLAGQLSMPLALFSIGPIIAAFGFGGAYLVSATGHIVIIVCVALMTYSMSASQRERVTGSYSFRQSIRDVVIGLQYARSQPVVLWVIVLLVLMMGLSFPATANLGPTWVTTVVGVSVVNTGYVMMNWGIGAVIGAIAMTWFSRIERRGMLVGGGTLLFSVSFLILASSPSVINAVIANLGLGASMAITMVSSTILIQHIVPNEVRGRIMSIFQLNMGFAQLMTLPVAMLAQWLTLEVVFPLLAGVTLVVVLLILVTQPQIARARVLH
jgi:predicted MFS family arabinose efflux permease